MKINSCPQANYVEKSWNAENQRKVNKSRKMLRRDVFLTFSIPLNSPLPLPSALWCTTNKMQKIQRTDAAMSRLEELGWMIGSIAEMSGSSGEDIRFAIFDCLWVLQISLDTCAFFRLSQLKKWKNAWHLRYHLWIVCIKQNSAILLISLIDSTIRNCSMRPSNFIGWDREGENLSSLRSTDAIQI